MEIEAGNSDELLDKFYQMLIVTRRRHRLPLQRILWFRNLVKCLGPRVKIWVASHEGRPVASIVTLSHKNTLIYKYGSSDPEFLKLNGTVALFWAAIQEAKGEGLTQFDLGRSDLDNQGLITFKDRWGAERLELTYRRSTREPASKSTGGKVGALTSLAFPRMPESLLVFAGKVLYRHKG